MPGKFFNERIRIPLSVLLSSLAVCFAGCGDFPNGMVMILDDSYLPLVVATESAGISSPDGLLFDNGEILIADEGGSACRIWNPTTQSITTICDRGAGISSPEDLVLDGDGQLFFSDDDVGGVWKTDRAGNCELLAGTDKGLSETEGIALSPAGDILVGDGSTHQIFKVTKTGEVSVFLGPEHGINKPEGMVFDDQGNLFIADNRDDVLYLWSAATGLSTLIANRPGFSPESIWFAKGVLYITDSKSGKIYQYTESGGLKPIAVFGGSLRHVQGITTDEQSNLYISVQTDLKRQTGYLIQLQKRKP